MRKVKEYLERNGASSLEGVREVCPKCGGLMDGLRISAEYVRCPECGYEEKGVDFMGAGIGAVVGFALGAIMTYLLKDRQ